ncbi:MAG: hypothetical protein PHH49_06300 [Candidatus Omnitrophica bacterium]|nr:hypothetical protein [Candidatus Omnitrophota bacterium]MDD5488551.1 hypothetical protein [Candidatus Omnitrophota bacterium]
MQSICAKIFLYKDLLYYVGITVLFIIGLLLLVVNPQSLKTTNEILAEREYGIKKKIIPILEEKKIRVIDEFVLGYRPLLGVIFTITAFVLAFYRR